MVDVFAFSMSVYRCSNRIYYGTGDATCINTLLAAGANVNAITNTATGKQTPLHLAATVGNTPVVQRLIQESDIDLNSLNRARKTAAEIADSKDFTDIAQLIRAAEVG